MQMDNACVREKIMNEICMYELGSLSHDDSFPIASRCDTDPTDPIRLIYSGVGEYNGVNYMRVRRVGHLRHLSVKVWKFPLLLTSCP